MTEKKWVLIGVINGVMGASLQVEGSHFATLFHAVFWYHHLDSSQKTPNKNSTKRTYTWIFQVCKICAFSPKKTTKRQTFYIPRRSRYSRSFLFKRSLQTKSPVVFFFCVFFSPPISTPRSRPPFNWCRPPGFVGWFHHRHFPGKRPRFRVLTCP